VSSIIGLGLYWLMHWLIAIGSIAHMYPCCGLTSVLTVLAVADAVPKAQEQIKETMLIAADIESFVKQTLGV
jgi:hypothetical protein